MTSTPRDDPAFPGPRDGTVGGPPGMTMREWFAGQALVGLLAWSPDDVLHLPPALAAAESFKMADAMIAESEDRPS